MSDKKGEGTHSDDRTGELLRRRVLQLSGAGLAGVPLLNFSIEDAAADEVEADELSVPDYDRNDWPGIQIDGPAVAEVGEKNTYEVEEELKPDHLNWRALHNDGGKRPELEGGGLSVDVTFLERGSHTVRAEDTFYGTNGSMNVTATGGPTPVDIEIRGPQELVADTGYQFEARPDKGGITFDKLDWSVTSLSGSEFDVVGTGLNVEIEIYTEGRYSLELEYETSEGYSRTANTTVEVFDLSRDRQNKVALADEVERLAVNLEENDLTETLDRIIARAKNGVVAPSTAREAIYRMQLAEDLTETTLAGMGPRTARSREDAKSRENGLVGEPRDSIVTQSQYSPPEFPLVSADVNLTGETLSSAVWMAAGLLTGAKAISKLVSKLPVPELSKTAEIMLSNVDSFQSLFPSEITIAGQILDAVNDLFEFIESEEEDDAVVLTNYLDEPVKYIRDRFSQQWQGLFETGGIVNSDLEDHLEKINEEMSGGGSGGINLQGTQEGAEAAAETGGALMTGTIEKGVRGLAALDLMSTIGDVLSVAAVFALAGGLVGLPIAAGVAAFGTFLTLTGTFLSTMNGSIQLWSLREIHERSINGIIAGADWS